MSRRDASAGAGQLPLPFGHTPSYGSDFLADESNADALAWLARDDWPRDRLALWGAAGVGKTHLLRVWAARMGGTVVRGAALGFAGAGGALAIDDAEAADEEALLHTLNFAQECRAPILLAARAAPARWATALPDLASRLRAVDAVGIGEPSESLLRALLARLLAERQLAVPAELQDYLLLHLPRTAGAVRDAAGLLDAESLLRGRMPARAVLKAIAERIVPARSDASAGADEETAAATHSGSQDGAVPV